MVPETVVVLTGCYLAPTGCVPRWKSLECNSSGLFMFLREICSADQLAELKTCCGAPAECFGCVFMSIGGVLHFGQQRSADTW